MPDSTRMEVDKQATEQYTSNKQINSLLIQKGPDGQYHLGKKLSLTNTLTFPNTVSLPIRSVSNR